MGLFGFILDALVQFFLPQTPWSWFVRFLVVLAIVIAVLWVKDSGLLTTS